MLSNLTTKAYISVTEGIRRFKENQQGVTAIEYGLIAVAMAVFVVAVLYGDSSFTDETLKKFKQLSELVTSALLNTS